MKKKWIKLLATLFMCATLALGFTACGEEQNESSNTGGGVNTEQGSSEQTHTHNYTTVVTAPTCTERGFTTHTCACGDSYVDTYVNALEHNFVDYVSNNNATCEQDGTETATCSRQGCEETDTRTKENSALNHDYGVITYTWDENQCTATRVCAHDNTHVETETMVAEYIKDTDATCTAPEKGHYVAAFTNAVFESQTTVSNSVENGAKLEHTHSTLKHSDTEHWYECVCGDKKGVEGHTPSAPATETTDQICTECERVLVPSLGHVHTLHLTKVNAKEQSCTETGNIEYYTCTCNKWFTDSTATTEIEDKNSVVLEKDTHNYGEWIEEIPTVCGENGVKAHYHCSECEQNFDANYNKIENLTILATEEHNYSEWMTVQSGGCSAVSYKVTICYKCAHYVLDADVDVDLVHPHEFELIEKAATCTEDGIEFQFKCKNCNFVAAEELIEALGHDLPEYEYFNAGNTHYQICKRCEDEIHERHTCYDWIRVKEPNCYETGLAEGVCLKCGLDIEKVLPIVHDWEFTKYETEPTCTENGVSLYTCSICSTTKTETAYKLGHNHQFNSVITAPTCTETGLDLYVCSRCGDEKEKTVSSLGHDWDDGIITIDPDCYKTGNKHYECEREGCDATKDEELAKKHTFNDGEIIIEPSCTINGKIKFTCQICKYSKELNLGVKHNTTYHTKVKATCTEDGNYEYWYCEDCNTYFSDVDSESCYFSYDGRNYYFDARIYSYQQSTLETLTITKTGHNIPDYFNEYDDDNHWQECLNDCGLIQNANEHEFEETFVVEVQRVSGGYNHVILHHWECLHCEYFINGEMDDDGNITPNDGETILHEHGTYEPVAPTLPSCVTKGYTAGLICGECAEVLVAQVELPALGHNFVDAICTRCGLNSKLGTLGLEYTLNSDGQSYSCSGMGTADTSFVVIGAEYNGLPVTKVSPWAFSEQYNLMSVVIPASIESIGSYAFYNCYKLVEVYNLSTNITVNKDSNNGYVGNYALDVYTDINTESKLIKLSGGYVFYLGERTNYLIGYCGNETTLNLPNIFAAKSYDIYKYAFYHNDNISNVTIGKRTTSIGDGAFYGCSSLTSVTIPDSVTSIGDSAFSGCSSLPSVAIGNSVTSIGSSAFYNCSSLTSVTIGNSVTSIGWRTFYNCRSLTSVMISDSVTSIGEDAFYGCDKIIIEQNGLAYVKANGNCFFIVLGAVDKGQNQYTIADGTKIIALSAFYNCSSLTSVTIPDSVTSIGDNAFRYCSSLTSVEIPDSVTFIGGYAFCWCSSLTSVTIGDNVTFIDACAFNNCTALTEIYYKATECADLRNYNNCVFSYAGQSGNGITVTIGAHVKKIPANLFYPEQGSNSPKITTVVFEEGSVCESIGNNAFYNCDGLTSITIPDNVTSIGSTAFYDCDSLTSVTIGDSVTTIGNYAFAYCGKLTEIYFNARSMEDLNKNNSVFSYTGQSGNGITVTIGANVKKIPAYLFNYNYAIVSVEFEEGSVCESIGNNAFYECSSLTSVTIPDNVTSIGDYAFYKCTGLTEIYFNARSMDDWNVSNSVFAYAGQSGVGIKVTIGANVTKIPAYLFAIRSDWGSYVPKIVSVEFEEGSVCESIGGGAFAYCRSLTSIVMPDSVTSIASSTFAGCSSLTSVTIPDSVTSIASSAFYNCSSLTSVVIGDSVTSIGDDAFRDCYKLVEVVNKSSSITVTKGSSGNGYVGYYALAVYNSGDTFETKLSGDNGYLVYTDGEEKILVGYVGAETDLVFPTYITQINRYAFYECTNLTSVVIGDSVTSIGDVAFMYCRSLTSVTIGNSVTSIDDAAFAYCDSLQYTIKNNVKYLGNSNNPYVYLAGVTATDITTTTIQSGCKLIKAYAFEYCSSLTEIVVPDSVTSIGYSAFYRCIGLTEITLPFVGAIKAGTSNTDFEDIFGAGGVPTSLKKVTITSAISIGDSAFSGCNSLTSVTIGDSVTTIGNYAFYHCSSLTSVTIGNSVTSIGDGAFYGCSSLTEIVVPDSVTSIGDYAFKDCSSLTSVVIGDSVTSIGNYAFGYCTSLTSVEIPDSVTSIGNYTFYNCTSLTSVEIPDSVTSIGNYTFYNCTSLTSAVIGDSVTSIGDYAFYGCSRLKSMVIPDSVTSIGGHAFYGCSSLTSVVIGNSVTSIGFDAFSGCNSLMDITLPFVGATKDGASNTQLGYLFGDSDSHYNKSVPSSLKKVTITSATSIGNYTFYNCSSLTSVMIGNSVTSIGSSVFYGCSSLTSMVIPDSVTSIGNYTFYNCSSLTSITFEDASAWYRTTSSINWSNKTGGTSTTVTTPSTNATYFTSTYYYYYWYKL